MNNKKQQNIQSEKTLTEIFKYNAGGEASEYHIIIHSTKPEDTYEEQLNAVLNTYDYLLTQELKGAVAILKRYFLSDAANQADTLLALTTEGSDLRTFHCGTAPAGRNKNSLMGLPVDRCTDTSLT